MLCHTNMYKACVISQLTLKKFHIELSRVKKRISRTNVCMDYPKCVTRFKCPVTALQILSRLRETCQKRKHCHCRRQQKVGAAEKTADENDRAKKRSKAVTRRFPSLSLPYNLPSLGARTDKFGPVVKNLFYWSARYMICAANSVECVFLSPNLYDVIAP